MDSTSNRKQRLSKEVAKQKVEQYCAYQERSQQEVRDKLYHWGLYPDEVEALIADLILENFLNEERFAKAYASGKFNIKGWGKFKIKQGLKQKMVAPRLISEALSALDNETYYEKLRMILEKKADTLPESKPLKRKQKLLQYALSKGYENDLIFDILNNNNL